MLSHPKAASLTLMEWPFEFATEVPAWSDTLAARGKIQYTPRLLKNQGQI